MNGFLTCSAARTCALCAFRHPVLGFVGAFVMYKQF
jgi:hypothetical protein